MYFIYSSTGKLVAMKLDGVQYNYIRNAQGDIVGLMDTAGNEVVTYSYDSWGKLESIDGELKDILGVLNPYRYRGYRYDTETGLYYLQSRYYNPEWGRFINADAIIGQTGELLGHNMFAYTKNNPVNASDPSGFRTIEGVGVGGSETYSPIKDKVFYAEGEGPKITLLGKSYKFRNNNSNNKTDLFGAQLINGEIGIAKVYGEYKHGQWYINAPNITADIGTAISWTPKASMYGKLSFVDFGGSLYIPLPFTEYKLEVGGAIDFLSIGGGLDLNLKDRDKKIKAGLHYGIGADIIIGLKR